MSKDLEKKIKIGYYAHHHGSGHINYARLIGKACVEHSLGFTIYSEKAERSSKPWEEYELEKEGLSGKALEVYRKKLFPEPEYLHYSPVSAPNIQRRNSQLLSEIVSRNSDLVIVDVSVEIAALCKAASVPYAYVRMFGDRSDAGHRQAYQGAAFLLAYYPPELEQRDTPRWVRDKTLYLGFISRYSERKLTNSSVQLLKDSKTLAYITGKGGSDKADKNITRLLESGNFTHIDIFGPLEGKSDAHHTYHGMVDNLEEALRENDRVVIAPGMNLSSEMIHLGKSIFLSPEPRPYGEQEALAQQLIANGYARPIEDLFLQSKGRLPQSTSNYKGIYRKGEKAFTALLLDTGADPYKIREAILQYDYIKNHDLFIGSGSENKWQQAV
jgi:hypothetical protein